MSFEPDDICLLMGAHLQVFYGTVKLSLSLGLYVKYNSRESYWRQSILPIGVRLELLATGANEHGVSAGRTAPPHLFRRGFFSWLTRRKLLLFLLLLLPLLL